jgi:hypothetical protein
MKSVIIIITLLLSNININAQNKGELLKTVIYSNLFFVKCEFIKNGKKNTKIGHALNINGKYVGTCYHLINPDDSSKLLSIKVIYVKR